MNKDRKVLRKIFSFEECIPNIQHLLVEYFGKLVFREHFEKNDKNNKKYEIFEFTLKKDSIIALIMQFLNNQATEKSQILYSEYTKTLKIYFLNIGKLPEILDKYYNLECEAAIEKLDQIKNHKVEVSISMNHSLSNSTQNNLPQEAKEFFEYIDEQTSILELIISLIRDFVEILIKLKDFCRKTIETLYAEDRNYYIHLNILENNLQILERLLNNSNEYKYLKNSYDSFLTLLYNDFNLLKSLLSAYKNILNLDMFLSTTNMIICVRTIDQIKAVYNNFGSLKLYTFFIYFYNDNYHKYHVIYETYLFNKQNSLVMEMSFNFDPNSKILEEIFKKKGNKFEEKFTQKCENKNLDLTYFILVFDKKKFFNSEFYEEKTNLLRIQYKNKMSFIDSNEDFGIVKIFHITPFDNTGKVLNELMSIDKKDFFGKHKSNHNFYIITYSITSFLFITAKLKDKNPEDILYLTEILIDLRNKFSNKHVFDDISSE